MRHPIRLTWAACALLAAAAPARANRAPAVTASVSPENPAAGAIVHLVGDATDDSTGFGDLAFRWSQKSGPAAARIEDTASNTTVATFPAAGTYVLELRASDGKLTGLGSVQVTVHEPLPFKVLSPAAGSRVEAGRPTTIRWQMDPSVPCMVYGSADTGRTWSILNGDGAVSDSFAWTPDPARYRPGARGMVKVEEYGVATHYATSAFDLAPAGTGAVRGGRPAGPGNLHGTRSRSADGRRLPSAGSPPLAAFPEGF